MLVDQNRCRGWRYCVSGCPYKKVYFNHRTGKAEKCTLCYPRIEIGQPTICSETCVGRIRYLGLVLYDADRVAGGRVGARRARPARRAARRVPRPRGPRGARGGARATGSPTTGSTPRAARRSTTSRCAGASRCRCTPSSARCRWSGTCRRSRPWSRRWRSTATRPTPTTSSARSTTCGSRSSTSPTCSPPATSRSIRGVLHRLAAMRAYMRKREVLGEIDEALPGRVGLTGPELERMYRLLAIADYEDRYVIPQAHAELGERLMQEQGGCGLDFDGGPGQLRRRRPAARHVLAARALRRRALPPDRHPQARGAPGAVRRARAAPPAPWALLSYLLRYPDAGVAAPRALATRSPRCPPGPVRAALERFVAGWTGDRRRSRRATSRRSTCAGARASSSPTTRTATRASAAWRCCA